jgi:hypothetical protein
VSGSTVVIVQRPAQGVEPDERAGDAQLRAERETGGTNTGRVYTVTYRTTDASGNVTQTTATVTVATNNSDK